MQADESLEICTLMDFFSPKQIRFRWKSTEELCLITLKNDAKFERNLTLRSKNDTKNLANFDMSSGKPGNFQFDMLLLLIAYKVSA